METSIWFYKVEKRQVCVTSWYILSISVTTVKLRKQDFRLTLQCKHVIWSACVKRPDKLQNPHSHKRPYNVYVRIIQRRGMRPSKKTDLNVRHIHNCQWLYTDTGQRCTSPIHLHHLYHTTISQQKVTCIFTQLCVCVCCTSSKLSDFSLWSR